MKKTAFLTLALALLTTACAEGPLKGLFDKGEEKTVVVKKPVRISVIEYWKNRSGYTGEVIEEHSSKDGAMLEGVYVPPFRLSGKAKRLTEKKAGTMFFLPTAELEKTGGLLKKPVYGKISSTFEDTDSRLTIDKGSNHGIKKGFLFVIPRFRLKEIPPHGALLMYQNGWIGPYTPVKAMGRVISVNPDSCVAETFGFRDLLHVGTGNRVRFGFDDAVRYMALKRIPEVVDFANGQSQRGPLNAQEWVADFFARHARKSAVPFLIEAVESNNTITSSVAHRALEQLFSVKKNLPPGADATARKKIAGAWREWWKAYSANRDNPWPPNAKEDTEEPEIVEDYDD